MTTSADEDERVTSDVPDLFRRHYLGLVRLAMRLVDDQDTAEDLVQDVFLGLSALSALAQQVSTTGDPDDE